MAPAASNALISPELYPSEDFLQYEEEVLRSPYSLKLWWRYLIALADAPFEKRQVVYERAVRYLPGSYKIWLAYLRERLELVRSLPVTHSKYESLNNTFERALVTMHKMPRIWIMYLEFLTRQKLVTVTRRTFDRALCALPVTQHDRIWVHYLEFVGQSGIPIETSLRVYRRYLKYDPQHMEDLIEFLRKSERWQETAERLAGVLNDDRFYSIKGKTKHQLWLELCDLLTQHAGEITGLNVDAIIRGGIRKFTDEVGRLWAALAEFYVRRQLFEKARDVFEEGMTKVVTVRDFGVIFDAYTQFEQTVLTTTMETVSDSDDEGQEDASGKEEDEEEDDKYDMEKLMKKCKGHWLSEDVIANDVDLRFARLEYLIERRPELANSVLLRQNPHNVEQWHRRVKLFEGKPMKQVLTYTEAVKTIDPMKAVGKPHTLWVAFAKLYESHQDIFNARIIFDKAVQVNYKAVDHLASVWCEWAEMELKHNNAEGALQLLKRATAEPSVEVKRRVAAEGNEPVQIKVYKSLKLWTLYVDLEESLGTLDSTCAVYERILDLRIATPQIIINYASLLETKKYFEESFKVYERGVKIFKYPHAHKIWVTYLTRFVDRFGNTKLERARELFEQAVEAAPPDAVKPLYLQYANLEEKFGLAKRAMMVYDQATKAVPDAEKLSTYEIYIARAAYLFGVAKTREIYEQAIASGLPDKDVKVMCTRYADLERSLGEIDRARKIFKYASQFADPRSDPDFWIKWKDFEIHHGNEDTFGEMLRVKRTVEASNSQGHFILPEYLMQKDQLQTLDEAKDALKNAGVAEDQMAALERQVMPTTNGMAKDGTRLVGFVSAGVESRGDGAKNGLASTEDIDLPDGDSDEDDEKVEISQKDVPTAVFGGLVRKREDDDDADTTDAADNNDLGALARFKRSRGA